MDENIIEELKQELSNHQFYIRTNRDRATTDTTFMRNFVANIKKLSVALFSFNSDDMKLIISDLSTSNIKVCFV